MGNKRCQASNAGDWVKVKDERQNTLGQGKWLKNALVYHGMCESWQYHHDLTFDKN